MLLATKTNVIGASMSSYTVSSIPNTVNTKIRPLSQVVAQKRLEKMEI